MRAYNYKITNNYSGKSFTIGKNDDGTMVCDVGRGILLQEYPTFELDVRNEEREKSGQHGIWDFFSFYGKRNITFSGLILANSHQELMLTENKMKEVLTLPPQPLQGSNDGYVNIEWEDVFGNSWNINAKIQQDLQFSRLSGVRTRSTFFINLKASSPYILSSDLQDTANIFADYPTRMGWRQSMFILPTFLPSGIGLKYNNVVNVYQQGTTDAPGVYRLHGPATNPKITKLIESFSDQIDVSDFTAGWTGGTPDTDHFQTNGQGMKLTSINGVPATMYQTGTWDLSNAEWINFYFYVDNIDNMEIGDYLTGENYIKFEESISKYFVAEFYLGNRTIRKGWNYFTLQKKQFETIGTPSWEDITKIIFSIKSDTGSTLNITFDELRNRTITYTEQYLKLNTTLSPGQYVDFDVLNGTIKRDNGADFSGYITLDSQWFYVSPRQNLFIYEDVSTPILTATYPYYFNNPVPEAGLVGMWHFDEESLIDYSVNSNTGVPVGAINYVQGDIQDSLYAIELDGASYITAVCPYNALGVSSASIVCWVYFDDLLSNNFVYSSIFGEGTYPYLYYDFTLGNLRFSYSLDGTPHNCDSSISISPGTWHAVFITMNVTTGVKMYIDDAFAGQNTSIGSIFDAGSNDMRFGVNSLGTSFCRGRLDAIRMFDLVLSSDEMADLFEKPYLDKYKNQIEIAWYDSIL